MGTLPIMAFLAGSAIAIQATMNAQLGVLLKNSVMATSIAFLFSCLFTLLTLVTTTKTYPLMLDIRSVPFYLWFTGGILSAFGVSMFYYLIPKMGVGSMMSYALTGQIIIAVIASHYGWFNQPLKPITTIKLIGAISLIIGVVLLNMDSNYEH